MAKSTKLQKAIDLTDELSLEELTTLMEQVRERTLKLIDEEIEEAVTKQKSLNQLKDSVQK